MPETPTEGTARDQAAVDAWRESFASMFVAAGVARMPARVFSALLTADSGSMTAAELAETLQASPAAISGAVRYLIQVQMISREREPGTRRDVFRLIDGMFEAMLRRRDALLDMWSAKFEEGARTLGESSRAGDRLQEAAEFFTYMAKFMPGALDQWREHRASLHPGQ